MTPHRLDTVVLHVGDHDPSGCAVFDSAADDLEHFVADLGHPGTVTFQRVAVTPEQVERYQLPSAPAKTSDQRGGWEGETVQAEALAPDQLADEVRQAVDRLLDRWTLARLTATEDAERRHLITATDTLAR